MNFIPFHISRRAFTLGALSALVSVSSFPRKANAAQVPFDSSWKHLMFRRLLPNQFSTGSGQVKAIAHGGSSIFYGMLEPSFHAARRAS